MGRIEAEEVFKSPFPPEFGLNRTPHTRFVTLDDGLVDAEIHEYRRSASRRFVLLKRIAYWCIAACIMLCLLLHVVGLLAFFSSWYNVSVQVWIFRRFYSSFASYDFLDDIDAKRSAVAFVYLLCVGIVPTVVAASLWFAFSGHRGLRRIVQTPSFLRRKPVFFSKWRPVYLDMTFGNLATTLFFFISNAFIFMQVLWRAKTHLASPSHQIFRDVSRGFGFNAIFMTAPLLFFALRPSNWSVYVDVFSMRTIETYRKWLSIVVVACSALHGICMAFSLALKGEFAARLFPAWNQVKSEPSLGRVVFGEIALVAMVAGMAIGRIQHRLNASAFVVGRAASVAVAMAAVYVHYPVIVAWLLPPLLLLLTQRAIAWTHTGAPVELVDIAPLPYGITRIVIRREVDVLGSNFTPGQFVYINMPIISRLEWRRCTIASSPGRNPGEITMYITQARNNSAGVHRFSASWSGQLHGVAERAYAERQAPVVHIDGFYGPTHASHYDEYRCLVLVAKNTGIVELLSMLEQLYHETWRAKSEAFSANDVRRLTALEDGIDPESGNQRGHQVWLMWTVEDLCLFKEFEDLFFRIQALDPTEEFFRLRFFLTKIPTREDLLFQRVPACDFTNPSQRDPLEGALHDGLSDNNPCRRAPYRLPQNHGGLCGWPSRPFQQAVSGSSAKIVALVLVVVVAVPLAISGEWHTLSLLSKASWHPRGTVIPVLITLLVAGTVAGTTALLNDYILSRQRRQRKRRAATETPRSRHVEMATPSQGITRLRSVTRRLDQANTNGQIDLQPRDTVLEPREIGPDVIERFKIYTMKPDVGKFLRCVGRSFPHYAGRIGVFASGSQRVVNHVEDCIIASEAMTGEWESVSATFDFHSVAV